MAAQPWGFPTAHARHITEAEREKKRAEWMYWEARRRAWSGRPELTHEEAMRKKPIPSVDGLPQVDIIDDNPVEDDGEFSVPLERKHPTYRHLHHMPRTERIRLKKEEYQRKLANTRVTGGHYHTRWPNPPPPRRLKEVRFVGREEECSYKRMNRVCTLIRGMTVQEAELQLIYMNKKVSEYLLVMLRKAALKARVQLNLSTEKLVVGQCYVNSRIIGHKVDIKGRGRSGKITVRGTRAIIHIYEHPALVPNSTFKVRSGSDQFKLPTLVEKPNGRLVYEKR